MALNAKPAIAFDDLVSVAVENSNITASSEDTASGYSVDFIGDWKSYTYHKGTGTSEQLVTVQYGSAQDVDCCIIHSHDLGTQGAEVHLERYDSGSWTEVAVTTASDDSTILQKFGTVSDTRFRLRIPTGYTAAPKIGIWHLSKILQFQVYADPGFDPDDKTTELASAVSRDGRLLGATRGKRWRMLNPTFNHVDQDWAEDTFRDTFWNVHIDVPQPKSFFFIWDYTNHPEQTYLVNIGMQRGSADLKMPYRKNFREIRLQMIGEV